MNRSKWGAVGAALALASASAHAITIDFDYSFDDGASRLSSGQRAILDFVADEFGRRIGDSLDAAFYSSINFFDPGAGSVGASLPRVSLANQAIAADSLRIYVGISELDGFGASTVGISGPGGASGSTLDRGESGVGTTDFAPWGGSIAFDSSTNWYVDDDPATLESFSGVDFYSIAVHELGHVLGVGTSGSWFAQIGAGGFEGSASVAAYSDALGSPQASVPLDSGDGHWAEGTQSFTDGVLNEASLDPSIRSGRRKAYTDLDWAALSDVGWEVAPASAVPENSSFAMMLAGLGVLGASSRRRAARSVKVPASG
ncbi:MAG: matrixin family metalloprotease [Zoogloeaceae bacterium]|nr:matrixin family metalloprotease [Rhodocyclaceae bacterium]MCP5238160.1 matrixin family metalloprotease [Zoogloeaceae bacterium]